jgi:hypothetical protein
MIAQALVALHHTTVQFCCKGVTGATNRLIDVSDM